MLSYLCYTFVQGVAKAITVILLDSHELFIKNNGLKS